MTRMDELLDHDDNCGQCYHQFLMAEVAREMKKAKKYSIHEWNEEVTKRWQEGKYYKLWQAETAAGRDPHKAFKKKGWEP